MSDLYSVISGIQPSQQDILEAELLAKQILEAKFPDLDLREGTGIRDVVIRPAAFLLALCKTGFDYYFSQNTLDKIDDTSPQELVDDLLSNLFLTRNTGSYAVVNVRLYFARQKAITLSNTISFSTDGDLLFFPTVSGSYPIAAMQFDAFQNEWFIDVDLIAGEKGSAYNISSGSLLYFSNFDPYFLHGEINYLSQASTEPETNLEFIGRAKSAISTRNLINRPSVDSILRSEFNYLSRIKPVGAGEPEMYRDQINVNGSNGITRVATSMILTDGNSKMLINLTGHGVILGQLVDVVETGTSLTKLVLKRVRVTDVVDGNFFKVNMPITVSGGTFLPPSITPVDENIYVHQGGSVDIYCSETTTPSLVKLTLDSSGSALVSGPVYALSRSLVPEGAADTLGPSVPYTIRVPGQVTDHNVFFSQVGDGTIRVAQQNHCMVLGRMVKVYDWPTAGGSSYLTVSAVIDSDNFVVGRHLPLYTPSPGPAPSLTYIAASSDVGFSDRQGIYLDFGSTYAGLTCTMRIDKFDHLDSLQSYLELSESRVLCADYLARGFDIYVLNIGLVTYDTALPSTGYATSLINKYLKSLAPGQDLILSDLVAVLTSDGGIAGLKTPIDVSYTFYTKDLFPGKPGTVVDVLVPENSTSIYVLGNVTTALGTL